MDTPSFSITPGAVAVPVLAFISICLDIPPIAWHIKNRNLAATSLLFWIILSNLFNFVNALIWPTDDLMSWWHGLVYCDIQVKFMLAATLGITGSLACIMRNLAVVLNTNRTVLTPTKGQRRTRLVVDILLCFGGPIYLMIIHYVVQPNRYYIFAITGCTPSFDRSWPSMVLVFIWPPIMCLLDVYYSVLVIIRMHKYRKEFSAILTSSNSNLTKSRFMRLFMMSLVLIVIFLPCQFYILYRNATFPHLPYSWDAIHGPAWWDITLIPTYGVVTFDHWIQLAVGYAVFFFFGMGADAMKMYRKWLLTIGFGRIFPSLHHQLPTQMPNTTNGSHPGSFSSRAHLYLNNKLSITSKYATSTSSSTATISPASPNKHFPPMSTISESDRASSTHSTSQLSEKASAAAPPSYRGSWLSRTFTFRFSTPPTDVEAQVQEPARREQRDYGRFYRNIWSTNRNPTTTGLHGGCMGGVSGLKV